VSVVVVDAVASVGVGSTSASTSQYVTTESHDLRPDHDIPHLQNEVRGVKFHERPIQYSHV